jgi:hypothetical protein
LNGIQEVRGSTPLGSTKNIVISINYDAVFFELVRRKKL